MTLLTNSTGENASFWTRAEEAPIRASVCIAVLDGAVNPNSTGVGLPSAVMPLSNGAQRSEVTLTASMQYGSGTLAAGHSRMSQGSAESHCAAPGGNAVFHRAPSAMPKPGCDAP